MAKIKMNKVGKLCFPNSAHFNADLVEKITGSSNVLKIAYAEYGPEIGVCFNGGKDSTVVLDLVKRFHTSAKITTPVKPFFIENQYQYPEILEYVKKAELKWDVEIRPVQADTFQRGVEKMMEEHGIKSFFIGQRYNHPNCKGISEFAPTTKSWKNAMRIFPILQWSYRDVWEYIDALDLPYCSLYDKGFTSIGNKVDARPNPILYNEEKRIYKHARTLKNEEAEREGRGKKF